MTLDEYEQLPLKEKEHFATCSECGEIFDRPKAWTKCCSIIPTISSALTFSMAAR